MEKWACTVTAGNSHDTELVPSLPQGETGGFHSSAEQAKKHLLKTPPDHLLNQVSSKEERFFYQTAR